MDRHNLAVEVTMSANDNDGRPTINVFVIPKTDPPSLDERRTLVVVHFGADAHTRKLTFYNPDGSVNFDMASRDEDEVVDDNEVAAALNEAWTGNPDDILMAGLFRLLLTTANMVHSAQGMAVMMNVDPQTVFDQLSMQLFADTRHYQRDPGGDHLSPLRRTQPGADSPTTEEPHEDQDS